MDTIDLFLDERSPRAQQPKGIKLTLKAHQLASLSRLKLIDRDCGMSLHECGINIHSNVGILADLAGYGKTITMLSLIAELDNLTCNWMPKFDMSMNRAYGYGMVCTQQESMSCIPVTLITVPDNLVSHWEQHIREYTNLKYKLVTNKNLPFIDVDDYNIILCPARLYNLFVTEHDYIWNRAVFDEADSIHIPNTKSVDARFLWMVTATYDRIPYRRNNGFLKKLFRREWYKNLMTEFRPVVIKCKDSFVRNSFALVEPEIIYVDCIQHHISPKVLEYLNAGDIDNAILALGGNVDTDRNIIALVHRRLDHSIGTLESKLVTINKDISEASEDEDRQSKLQQRQKRTQEKLAAAQEKKETLTKAIEDATTTDCTICYETLQKPTLVPCCNNMFCGTCLLRWLKESNNCPMCRGTIDAGSVCTISHKKRARKSGRKKRDNKLSKMDTVIDLINDNPNGRFIVFSGHAASFNQVGRELSQKGIAYGVLTSAFRTEKTLRRFRSGELFVILLDARYNGAGLEITQATDVILYHEMRNSLQIQAIARAQRPGRNSQLRVWKLKYRNEYCTF